MYPFPFVSLPLPIRPMVLHRARLFVCRNVPWRFRSPVGRSAPFAGCWVCYMIRVRNKKQQNKTIFPKKNHVPKVSEFSIYKDILSLCIRFHPTFPVLNVCHPFASTRQPHMPLYHRNALMSTSTKPPVAAMCHEPC